MDARDRHGVLTTTARGGLVALLLGIGLSSDSAGQQRQPADTVPTGVTPALLAEGKQLFGGQGLCLVCHGDNGKGGIGPDLTDQKWLHGSGTYPEIVRRIVEGVTLEQSTTGQIMPPKGGGTLDDAQVKAVAAYVWKLSRPGREP